MRNTLTSNERLELGIFVGAAALLCVALAAVVQLRKVPSLSATREEPIAREVQTELTEPTLQFNEPINPPMMDLNELLPVPAPAEKSLARAPRVPAPEIKTYAGKQYRFVKTLRLRVTAYAADPRCTYPYPGTTTATGLPAATNGGRLVAADPSLIAMHSLVSVPGYAGSAAVPVLDKGGAIKGYRLDVLLPSYTAAQKWGSRLLDVKVYSPVK